MERHRQIEAELQLTIDQLREVVFATHERAEEEKSIILDALEGMTEKYESECHEVCVCVYVSSSCTSKMIWYNMEN